MLSAAAANTVSAGGGSTFPGSLWPRDRSLHIDNRSSLLVLGIFTNNTRLAGGRWQTSASNRRMSNLTNDGFFFGTSRGAFWRRIESQDIKVKKVRRTHNLFSHTKTTSPGLPWRLTVGLSISSSLRGNDSFSTGRDGSSLLLASDRSVGDFCYGPGHLN